MFLPLNMYMVVASQLLGVAADQVPTYDSMDSSERYGLTSRPPTRRGARP